MSINIEIPDETAVRSLDSFTCELRRIADTLKNIENDVRRATTTFGVFVITLENFVIDLHKQVNDEAWKDYNGS